jgi:adenine-specific DNA-methyltransferase
MQLSLLSPRKSLNKAYLKVKPSRAEIELFKKNLIGLLDGLDESESEEHNKNDLVAFLKNTFYGQFYVNTKERTDLVIHSGQDPKSLPGIMIEAKKPSNKSEMIRPDNLNAKAFHELILYYLRERITNHNLEIKHLVVTNIYEWFVFDAILFEKTFAGNKKLVQQFNDFEEGRLPGKNTEFFYKEIAEPFVSGLASEVYFTWFDFREYDKPLRNEDKKDDSKLIALYKLLSPEHLLKLPFANDSNSLDKAFYTELLHIIGLTETKEGSKKLIGRKKEGERNSGSLIESAIIQLDNLDKISRLEKPAHFGETIQERLFNVALELAITWINRILFLKLLEAQMIRYHKGDPAFAFLNCEKVQNFDDLNTLFFGVLARIPADRSESVRKLYANVPYLNSSLFEPTPLEHSCLFISQLKDDKLPIISSTVLKDNNGKKFKGELFSLEYLFKFLDAYDFAGEGSEEIQEENKTLINASVLGLIFEKINGYKDGSFFTPGFITMYMCRETIRRAVVQKFNDFRPSPNPSPTGEGRFKNLIDVYNAIDTDFTRTEANAVINSLKICDPAVGSGHFLVSALNEIIAIKSELKILSDEDGKRLKEYHVEVVNDELIITDEDGDLFEYNPSSPESQRVQETLFKEKQTIIENCLFGVDINPNSVKICRLRLWIELLKNAFYKNSDGSNNSSTELETLPNIDINIKCGNSLISRYALDADIRQALKKSKWSIFSYRNAIMTYRNAENKEQKHELERLITIIKTDFQSWISMVDPDKRKLDKLKSERLSRFTGSFLFEPQEDYGDKKNKEKSSKTKKKLDEQIEKVELKIENKLQNKLFENAFEWRFEFPEVLNEEGDFVGFDVVIGNPPYIDSRENEESQKDYWKNNYQSTAYGKTNTYEIFIEKGLEILKEVKSLSYIVPIVWLSVEACQSSRRYMLNNYSIIEVAYTEAAVFNDANVDTMVLQIEKRVPILEHLINVKLFNDNFSSIEEFKKVIQLNQTDELKRIYLKLDSIYNRIQSDLREKVTNLSSLVNIVNGIATGPDKEKYFADKKLNNKYKPLILGNNIQYYKIEYSNIWINYDRELLHRAREESIFLAPEKIVMQRIRNVKLDRRIVATLDTNQYYTFNSVNNLLQKDENYNLRYILGVLNSRLVNFLIKRLSTNTNLTAQDLDTIPFRIINFRDNNEIKIFNSIISLVDKILKTQNENPTIKKSNISSVTDALENEIDRLVYELYGLTEEEIKIVENTK